MSSNFEWQKRQANERVQLRLREAAEHRRARQGRRRVPLARTVMMIIPALVGLIVVIWLLTGCTSVDGSAAEADTTVFGSETLTMADRIRFQDKLEANRDVETNVSEAAGLTLAARIQFQDRSEAYLREETALPRQPAWTMADRIRFHDQILSDLK